MRKVSLFKKLALFGGLFVAGAAMLVSLGTSSTAEATSCTKGSKYTDFVGSYSGRDTMTIHTKDNIKLCNDVDVHFASFIAPENYNGKGFKNNPTAIPQSQYYIKTVTLKKGTTGKTTVTVKVPDECTNYQIDAYIGPIQTTITTSEGFIDTNAIVGKLFQKTKDDCSVPKVDACNTETGVIEKVEKGKENIAPYTSDLSKCKVTVCDTSTTPGTIVTISKEVALSDKERYVDQNDEACNPPEKVKACNMDTGDYDMVEKGQENVAPHTTNTDYCETVTVCNTETGNIVKDITKQEAKDSKYADQSDEACNPPKDIPSTGPAEIISGVLGTGSLAGAGSMYIKSRRSLFRFFK